MNLFDPTDCRAARDLIARGQDLAAAKLLIASPDKLHRAAQQMLAELQPRLIDQAKLAAEQLAWDVASDWLDTAAACMELPVEASLLAERVQRERVQRDEQVEWQRQRLQDARELAGQGRAMTACDLLRPLEQFKDQAIQHERADYEERLVRCQRYLEEAELHLDRNELSAARERLDRAREIHRANPKLIALEQRYRAARTADEQKDLASGAASAPRWARWPLETQSPLKTGGLTPPRSPVLPVTVAVPVRPIQMGRTSRTSSHMPPRFLLNNELLVLTGHEIVIGNARGDGVGIPLTANIHSRHALLLRHRREYQLISLSGCETRLNGVPVAGAQPLTDGDILQFGPPGCLWRFRRPVTDSATAVIESVGATHFGLSLPGAAGCHRVALMADELRLTGDDNGHHHLVSLPARELQLRRGSQGLMARATGGAVFIDGLAGWERIGDEAFSLPARLLIRSTQREAEMLRQEMSGQSVVEELRIELRGV